MNLKAMKNFEVSAKSFKVHLWTLPRWFASPFFGLSTIMGALLAGGMSLNSWLGVIGSLFLMAGGHSFNSFLDYAWTGLDKGKLEDRSAEKFYTGGQSLLARGELSLRMVVVNAVTWYFLGLLVLIYLALQTGWMILIIGFLGMLITFWYSKAKFNWTHELALAVGVGPLPVLIGMFATIPNPHWIQGILAGIPFGIVLSFAGLAVDEWPDAEANLKKGVKSLAYKVWEYGVSLEWYLSSWLSLLFMYQVLLITVGIYKPLTGISFLAAPLFIACMVFLKNNFSKAANVLILVAVLYFILLVTGQAFSPN
jgi:1,4-dihydroxy-2-naphthoate octaprenyltransferase